MHGNYRLKHDLLRNKTMPYIPETQRELIDSCINELQLCLKSTLINGENIGVFELDKLNDNQILKISGVLNYAITRLCCGLMCDVSYGKIAILTGVLENVKQEFYRRAAAPYEDKKIIQNGDVKEYKKI